MPTPSRPRPARRGRAALAWAAAAFVAAQLLFTVAADGLAPDIYDPEYAARLERLRAQRARHPDRPLLLALGSSRVALGFRPERLPPLATGDGRRPIPFNFAHMGAGPVYARMTLDRLTRAGLAPEWVVLELMPAFLADEWMAVYTKSAAAGDLGLLCRYTPRERVYGDYLQRRLLPVRAVRRQLLERAGWETPDPAAPDRNLDELGGERGRMVGLTPAPERAGCFAAAAAGFGPAVRQFRVSAAADRAVRDLVADCRARGVPVVLLLTPEATAFRAIYPPAALAALGAFTRDLAAEPGVRVVDARGWLADDRFADGHHVNLPGQADFTDRLGAEVLRPLVAGAGFAGEPLAAGLPTGSPESPGRRSGPAGPLASRE